MKMLEISEDKLHSTKFSKNMTLPNTLELNLLNLKRSKFVTSFLGKISRCVEYTYSSA